MIDERIGTLLEDLASTDGPPSAINIDQAMTDGRRGVRARRIVASAVAAVALIAVAGGIVAATGHLTGHIRGQSQPAAPTGTAIDPHANPRDPAKSLAMWSPGTNTIRAATGANVTLTPAPGLIARSIVQVPGGWVFDAVGGGAHVLYFQRTGHEATAVAPLSGTFEVSPDGKAIVAAGLATPGTAAAELPHVVTEIALPSLTVQRKTHVGGELRPTVVSVSGSLVLLRGQNGAAAGAPGSVWNLSTGTLTDLSAIDRVWPWSISPTGQILGVNFAARNGGGAVCVYLAPMADATTAHPGHCFAANGPTWGSLSPDGAWVLLDVAGHTSSVLSIDTSRDVATGGWNPWGRNTASSPMLAFWNHPGTFIVTTEHGYWVCDMPGLCAPVALPAGIGSDGRLIPHAGS